VLQYAAATNAEQEHVLCTACGALLQHAEAHYGHPLITARQLITMGTQAAIRSPKLFGEVMLAQLPPVPYCAACRQQLPAKRQAEQLKFMMGVLVLIVFLIALSLMVATWL
jgi:hypothetical protein